MKTSLTITHAELEKSDKQIILIGHSLGGYMLLKYLSEQETPSKEIVGVCIIAAPYPSGDKDWEFEGFDLLENFATKLPKNAKQFLYHSKDDEVVPFAHMQLYADKLTAATTHQTVGGHQLGNDLSIVAKDIKQI